MGKIVLPFTWSQEEGEATITANITDAVKKLSYWNESLKIRIETTGEWCIKLEEDGSFYF